MKSQDTKSSDELKREVHHELKHVRRDMDEMTDMLSPGTLLDRAVFKRHNQSLRASFDHLKNNPIGTTFLTMGTILLMEDEFNETYETKLHNRFVDLKGQAALQGEAASDKMDEIKGRFNEMKQDLVSKTQDLKERVESRVNEMGDRVGDVKDSIQNKVQNVQDKISGLTQNVGHQTENVKGGVSAKVTDFADKIQDAESSIQNKVEDVTQNVQRKVQGLKQDVQSKVQSLSSSDYENWKSSSTEPRAQKVKDAIGSAKERISSGIEAGKDKMRSEFESGREMISNMDPMTYMALGAGLGVLTGASLPVSETERNFVNENLTDKLSNFDQDIRSAINECSNVLKDLVISEVKDHTVKFL